MLKTFIAGILIGLAAAAGALYALPAVDQFRETSIVSVAPNGGNIETYRIKIPTDRIMLGAADQPVAVPPGLEWPGDEIFSDVRTELFKIRNVRDAVIGVAMRTAVATDGVIDWVLHMPARGSVYVTLDSEPGDDGLRSGAFRAGSREFGPLMGRLTERWVANTSGDEDAPAGHIELVATYVGQLEPVE